MPRVDSIVSRWHDNGERKCSNKPTGFTLKIHTFAALIAFSVQHRKVFEVNHNILNTLLEHCNLNTAIQFDKYTIYTHIYIQRPNTRTPPFPNKQIHPAQLSSKPQTKIHYATLSTYNSDDAILRSRTLSPSSSSTMSQQHHHRHNKPGATSDGVDGQIGATSSSGAVGIPSTDSSQHLIVDSDSTGTNSVAGGPNGGSTQSVRQYGDGRRTGVTAAEWFAVIVLCFVNLINYMDRFTIAGEL